VENDVFFIDPQKTKVNQNCYIDLLKTSLLPEFRRLYPGTDLNSVTPRKSDATVSMTQHFRLHSCWWMGIIFSMQTLILYITVFRISCRIWCTKADDFSLQIYLSSSAVITR